MPDQYPNVIPNTGPTTPNLVYNLSTSGSAHSLQAMMELVFMNTANNLLYNQMAPLQSALVTTNNSLNILANLQNIHNAVTTVSAGKFNWSYSSHAAGTYMVDYPKAASAFFNSPVLLKPNFAIAQIPGSQLAAAGMPSTNQSLDYTGPLITNHALSTSFASYLSALNQIISETHLISTSIIPLLSATTPIDSKGPNSLLGSMKTILSSLHGVNVAASWPPVFIQTKGSQSPPMYSGHFTFPSGVGSLTNWLIDGYNTTAGGGDPNAGKINQYIVNGVTAAESLNTSQTQEVRNYLLLYQEYYQTASALLTQMTQIIKQIAQHISQ